MGNAEAISRELEEANDELARAEQALQNTKSGGGQIRERIRALLEKVARLQIELNESQQAAKTLGKYDALWGNDGGGVFNAPSRVTMAPVSGGLPSLGKRK